MLPNNRIRSRWGEASRADVVVVVLLALALATGVSMTSLAGPDSVELSGQYEYRTDAESLNIIGDAVCFFPDPASIERVPRARPLGRTLWFCFSGTPRARAALAIPDAPSPCGYRGNGKVIVSNYKPYLGEGDGHDVADLERVISSELPQKIPCGDAG